MCGRFVSSPEGEIERFWHIGADNWHNPFKGLSDRYNIAPQQGNPENYIVIIRNNDAGDLELVPAQWWLLPFWSKEPKIKYTTFNARVEGIDKAASFREPFKRRRCIIPATGWFEWQEHPEGKRPWYFYAADGNPLAIAGIWDRWEKDGRVIESCAMVVGEPNEAVGAVHDRMPLFIDKASEGRWLDRTLTDTSQARDLLRPTPDHQIMFHRVPTRVNSARNQGIELILPMEKSNP